MSIMGKQVRIIGRYAGIIGKTISIKVIGKKI